MDVGGPCIDYTNPKRGSKETIEHLHEENITIPGRLQVVENLKKIK